MKRRFGALILLTALVFTLVGCGLIVERPEVKEGEFNFSVTYEINGEIKTISGVYVCEYDGIDRVLDGVDHREWKGYIKDGTTEEQIKLATAEDGGVVELNLHFAPEYFMGESYGDDDEPFSPSITVRLEDEEGLSFENDANLIAEVYGAKIISYEYDKPIENSFGVFK